MEVYVQGGGLVQNILEAAKKNLSRLMYLLCYVICCISDMKAFCEFQFYRNETRIASVGVLTL